MSAEMQPLGLLPPSGERRAGLLGQSRALWRDAPAWRLLVVSTAVLCAASIASPLLLPEHTAPPQPAEASAPLSLTGTAPRSVTQMAGAVPQQQALASPGEDTCPMRPLMGHGGQGQIITFLTRAQASAMLVRTQTNAGGEINPHYLSNVRAVVGLPNAASPRHASVLVPSGMVVHLGDRVVFTAGHRDWTMPCNYIPNLITSLAPARPDDAGAN